jgi:molybdopterin/thiamine biosynthesis adenylyltransferase
MSTFPVIRDADRVRRLLALPSVRPAAVERLRAATVAVVGVGGLGAAAAPYLAAAGVGRLRLIDPDRIRPTDLGRQVLYTPADVGRLKVEAAAEALSRQAPETAVEAVGEALSSANGRQLLEGASIVVDGLDNGAVRDWLNRYAVETGTPVVFGGALGYEGQVTVVHEKPCLACLFGSVADAPQDCARDGVLGPLVAVVGGVEAAEALKWIMGLGTPLVGRVWQLDLFSGQSRVLAFPARADCPVCGQAGAVPPQRPGR